jgi:hypothetical protein
MAARARNCASYFPRIGRIDEQAQGNKCFPSAGVDWMPVTARAHRIVVAPLRRKAPAVQSRCRFSPLLTGPPVTNVEVSLDRTSSCATRSASELARNARHCLRGSALRLILVSPSPAGGLWCWHSGISACCAVIAQARHAKSAHRFESHLADMNIGGRAGGVRAMHDNPEIRLVRPIG